MALINRLSRLFRADLHAVLDRIEEPDILLKQALREMQEAIHGDETRHKQLQLEHKQLNSRHLEIQQKLTQLESELDVCFESDKDELAHNFIKRKLEAQRFSQHLARKQDDVQTAINELEVRLRENRARLTAMQQKLQLLCEDERNTGQDESWLTPDFSVSDDEVEVAFLREKQARMSA